MTNAGFDFGNAVLKLKCMRQADPESWKDMARYFPARCRAPVDAQETASGVVQPAATLAQS